jgi:hypothetical protein
MTKSIKKIANICTQAEHHFIMRLKERKLNISLIDRIVIFSGPLIPIAISFQAYDVWFRGGPEGLSLVTWSLLLFSSVTMALYALYHKATPLMITYLPLVMANLLIVIAIIMR